MRSFVNKSFQLILIFVTLFKVIISLYVLVNISHLIKNAFTLQLKYNNYILEKNTPDIQWLIKNNGHVDIILVLTVFALVNSAEWCVHDLRSSNICSYLFRGNAISFVLFLQTFQVYSQAVWIQLRVASSLNQSIC